MYQCSDKGCGIFSGERVRWVTLQFSAQRTRWVSRGMWYPLQKSHINPAGGSALQVLSADTPELTMDILRYGIPVEAMSPSGGYKPGSQAEPVAPSCLGGRLGSLGGLAGRVFQAQRVGPSGGTFSTQTPLPSTSRGMTAMPKADCTSFPCCMGR